MRHRRLLTIMRAKAMVALPILSIIVSTEMPQARPAWLAESSASPHNNQVKQPSSSQETIIACPTNLITLDVTVVDRNNQPVLDLTRDDFTAYEDNVKQELVSWCSQEMPVSLGLVIDTSGSIRPKLQTVSDAALSLIMTMLPKDEAFVAQFKAEVELAQDFTHDRRKLEDAINELFTGGGTSLMSAVANATNYTQQKGQRQRKAVIVITDGLDNERIAIEKDAVAAINGSQVQVYFICLLDTDFLGGIYRKWPMLKPNERLPHLAAISGGRAFFPHDQKELQTIAAHIAIDLHRQYVLGYYPTNEKFDSTFRNIRVEVHPKDNRKLTVLTRSGYYATKPKT